MSGIAIVAGKLQANASLKAVVPANKMYLGVIAQTATLPLICIDQVSGSDGLHLNGQNEYPLHRVMVECCAASMAAALSLGELVRDALRNTIKETVGSFTDVDIMEASDTTDYSDDRTTFRRLLQFHVRFRRS